MAVLAAPSATAQNPQRAGVPVVISGGNNIQPVRVVIPVDAAPRIYAAPVNKTYGYAS